MLMTIHLLDIAERIHTTFLDPVFCLVKKTVCLPFRVFLSVGVQLFNQTSCTVSTLFLYLTVLPIFPKKLTNLVLLF